MDKIYRESNLNETVIKIGINIYKCFIFLLFAFCLLFIIFSLIFERDIIEILISSILSLILFVSLIFTERIIDLFHFPTRELWVTQNKMCFKEGKKIFEYKIEDITMNFYSWDLVSIPHLVIIRDGKALHYIAITKKQYNLIQKIISK